ncbi:EF-hand calcium-binding domain-containing protein 12-like [Tubulanus polymorphus]|uniref:EF-hand calcium-binding domain-containing protein 12-like n=1 Tax=Tubulanus polymorphus TaxID=672921 RepID=UPI003DA6A9BF
MMAAADVEIQLLHNIPAAPEDARQCREVYPRCESEMSDLGLEWLFSPDNYDHLTVEEQLKLYKQRDLTKTKIFKFATKIFWEPRSRKRVITATSKEQLRGDPNLNDKTPWTADIRKQVPKPVPPTKEELIARVEADKRAEFKNWLDGRKELRSKIDSLGLTEELLQKKKDRTPMEQRLLSRMIEERQPKVPTPEPEPEKPIVTRVGEAQIRRPCPESLIILEKYLKEKKLRLLDLFAFADKDKSWTITMDEFRDAIKKAEIPLSGQLLEDLIMSLDSDMNNELDYRELAKGISQFKQEQRQTRRKQAALEKMQGKRSRSHMERSAPVPLETDFIHKSNTYPEMEKRSDVQQGIDLIEEKRKVEKANVLSTPPKDTTMKERFVMKTEEEMVDIRKQTRTVLSKTKPAPSSTGAMKTDFLHDRSMIKIGHKGIDDHCRPSTLDGEVGIQIDKFRQARLLEYHNVIALCKERNVKLNEKLLGKVLLYPPEKPRAVLRKKLRQPGTGLFSSTFLMPPKRPPTPQQCKRSKTGKLLIDGRYLYPPYKQVKPVGRRVQLPTGKAVIKRQVDCWMTFEEYCKLTETLTTHYKDKYGSQNENAFWPGHLENKIKLVIDGPVDSASRVAAAFQPITSGVRSNYGYDNDLNTWPVGANGYVQYGTLEPFTIYKR